jgi:hypothetical protein
LRRAGRGKREHGGCSCRCQPSRHIFRTFQLFPRSFRVCGRSINFCFARYFLTSIKGLP